MDWSTSDYTQTYADTFFLPDRDHDTGIYPLDEAGAGPKNSWLGPDPIDAATDSRIRAPIRPYEGGACGGNWCGAYPRAGRFGRGRLDSHRATPFNAYQASRGLKEGWYTGGNIISDRTNNRAVFDAAWDERPLHYNPNSGSDWAHLVPPRSRRPYGGGPAPSLAFPMISQSEAQVGPKDLFTGAPEGPRGGAPASASTLTATLTAETAMQVIKIILLVIIVVLLAMTLVAASRLERRLEKAARAAAPPLGA